jgi:hypothetical protein
MRKHPLPHKRQDPGARDARFRRLWSKCFRASDEAAIQAATGCAASEAWTLAAFKEVACGEVIEAWLNRRIYFAKAWRIASEFARDFDAQRRELEPFVRRYKKRFSRIDAPAPSPSS